ncbi:MAG TPA: GerMN domain-containing protein, partial [Roseiflexaceae bacterium]
MGLSVPTTSDATPAVVGGAAAAPLKTGVRGWYSTLPARDRAIYAIMLAMLAIIVAIYLFVGLQTLFDRNGGIISTPPTSAPTSEQVAIGPSPTSGPTSIPPTPTNLPPDTPEPSPTVEPTQAPLILPPTSQPTQPATVAPSASGTASGGATATSASPSATSSAAPSTARPAAAPTTAARPKPTSAPAPTPAPLVPLRPGAPAPTPAPLVPLPPNEPPPVAASAQAVTLYFGDATGSVIVPVRRNTSVVGNRVAESAIRELIAGPRNGLGRLVRADAKLLGISIRNSLATVNFDRDPAGGDKRGYDSIVFTLTEFPTIGRIQLQVNGANLGGVRGRPVINPINPDGLPDNKSATEYLPLYFPSADGSHDVRLIRMVPKTKQTAEGTIRALLEGPGPYAGAVRRVI